MKGLTTRETAMLRDTLAPELHLIAPEDVPMVNVLAVRGLLSLVPVPIGLELQVTTLGRLALRCQAAVEGMVGA